MQQGTENRRQETCKRTQQRRRRRRGHYYGDQRIYNGICDSDKLKRERTFIGSELLKTEQLLVYRMSSA